MHIDFHEKKFINIYCHEQNIGHAVFSTNEFTCAIALLRKSLLMKAQIKLRNKEMNFILLQR